MKALLVVRRRRPRCIDRVPRLELRLGRRRHLGRARSRPSGRRPARAPRRSRPRRPRPPRPARRRSLRPASPTRSGSRTTRASSSPTARSPRRSASARLRSRPCWKGPTPSRRATACAPAIPEGTELLGLSIDDRIARVDLTSEFETGGGSAVDADAPGAGRVHDHAVSDGQGRGLQPRRRADRHPRRRGRHHRPSAHPARLRRPAPGDPGRRALR